MLDGVSAGFLAGMITMGHLIAGLYFIKFWRRTADKLFLAFAIAFLLLGLNQALLGLSGSPPEDQGAYYLLRLLGFLLIIVAIVAKNLAGGRR